MQEGSDHGNGSEPSLYVGHVSADFPDMVQSHKTPVIERLVALATEPMRHRVLSLNRVSPKASDLIKAVMSGAGIPRIAVTSQADSFGETIRYHAPGKGMFHVSALRQLGAWIAEHGFPIQRPDLLVGHKLCVEGIAVHHAAANLDIPFAITIQGNTDLKILRHRPDLRSVIAKVFHSAAHVFSFAPWSLAAVEDLLGKRAGPSEILPCPPDFTDIMAPNPEGRRLLSVFHLHNAKGKNLPRMAAAMDRVVKVHPDCRLDIVGGGTPADVAQCAAMVGGRSTITLAGAMDRAALRQRMNASAGLILPSLQESFGLVFIEALLSGLPIAYPKGAAVDGYFDRCPFAIATDARDLDEIAAAMIKLARDSAKLKQELREWQTSAAAQPFLPDAIGQQFRAGLQSAAVSNQE